MTFRLALLRHGESEWNRENRFTGWTDVALTDKGLQEAHTAGVRLREQSFRLIHCKFVLIKPGYG